MPRTANTPPSSMHNTCLGESSPVAILNSNMMMKSAVRAKRKRKERKRNWVGGAIKRKGTNAKMLTFNARNEWNDACPRRSRQTQARTPPPQPQTQTRRHQRPGSITTTTSQDGRRGLVSFFFLGFASSVWEEGGTYMDNDLVLVCFELLLLGYYLLARKGRRWTA
ncbi:hypothetical protein B0T24DRAFT_618480 [Lasiosphaeria ovina]|uniref:Uncharacterized protein n=1 Tax=Lasiosphaeria ovina TaxID=92902 RepID=A0AAE0KGX4_9PEZI|nr:hypothetical protein B0T24DRAFT_618480 [Lasiosphaeria ovina]